MNINSFRLPEITSPQARNAYRVGLIGLPASIVAASFYLYLALTIHAWQLYGWSADMWVLAGAVLMSMVLIRRGRVPSGVWLLLVAIQATFIIAVALIQGTGLVLGISIAVLVSIIAGQSLSSKAANRATMFGAASSALAILLDQFLPAYRLAQPEQTSIFLPVILGIVVLLFGYVTIQQFRNYSLRNKLIISFVVIAFISVVGVGYFVDRSSRAVLTDTIGNNLSIISTGQADQVAQTLTNELNLLNALALTDAVQQRANAATVADRLTTTEINTLDQQWKNADAANNNSDPLVSRVLNDSLSSELLKFQAKYPENVEVFLTDRAGVSVATTDRTSDYLQSDEDWWQAAYKNGEYIGQPEFDASSKTLAINMAVVVRAPYSDQVVGVLRTTVNINSLADLLSTGLFGNTGETSIYLPSDQEIKLVHGNNGQYELAIDKAGTDIKALLAKGGKYQITLVDNIPSLVSAASISGPSAGGLTTLIKNLGWYTVAHQDQVDALQPVTSQTQSSLIWGVIIAAIAALAAVVLAQLLAGPIIRLNAVAERVADGDLTMQAKVEARDETGTLATTFNKMVSQLNGLIGTLEERVAERTHSLELAAEVGRSVSQVRALEEMLKDATELIRSRFDLYYVQVYLTDPSRTNLVLRAGTGAVGQDLVGRGHSLPINTGSINGQAAVSKHSVVIADTAMSATFRPNPLLPETRSEMAVPLFIGDRIVGVLDMQSRQTGALSAEILPAFEALAGQLAVAIQNANLLADAEQARAEVESQARRLVRTNWEQYLDAIHQPERTGFVFEGNQIIPLADAADTKDPQAGNVLAVPIAITGEPVGELIVETGPEAQNAELVSIVARQVAQQIENLRLLENAERYRAEAEKAALRLTTEGWKKYMEARSGENLGYMYDLKEVVPLNGNHRADEKSIALPLKVHDEMVGKLAVMGIDSGDSNAKELAEAVAQRLATHIESLRQYDQTQSALAQSETLFEASRRLTQATNLQELVNAAVSTLNIHRINRAVLTTFNYDSSNNVDSLDIVANWWNGTGHEVTAIGTHYPLDVIRVMPMFVSPTPVFFNDTFNDARVDKVTLELVKRQNLRAVAVLPLHVGSRQTGALILEAEDPHNFTQDEMRLFSALAPQIATVLENRRQYEHAQQQAERESMLNAISQKIQSATTVEAVLQIAARELGHALGAPLTIAQLGMKDHRNQ